MLAHSHFASVGFNADENQNHLDTAAISLLAINTMKDMVVWITADGSIVFANASAMAHFGRGDPDLINKKIYDIDHDFSEELWRAHWQEILERKSFRFETAHRLSKSYTVPVEVSVNLIEHEGTLYNCAVFHDITERKRLQEDLLQATEKLERLALTDPLTGLGNRREFERRIADEWAGHRRSKSPLSLLLIDVDHFKSFNDTYGHPEGDECLRQVADALTRCVRRESDLVARIGGEEFACLLPNTNHAGALMLANAIRDKIMAMGVAHKSSPVAPVLTVSIGGATSLQPAGVDLPVLINAADRCLYEAKEDGRNRVSCRPLDAMSIKVASGEVWQPEKATGMPSCEAVIEEGRLLSLREALSRSYRPAVTS